MLAGRTCPLSWTYPSSRIPSNSRYRRFRVWPPARLRRRCFGKRKTGKQRSACGSLLMHFDDPADIIIRRCLTSLAAAALSGDSYGKDGNQARGTRRCLLAVAALVQSASALVPPVRCPLHRRGRRATACWWWGRHSGAPRSSGHRHAARMAGPRSIAAPSRQVKYSPSSFAPSARRSSAATDTFSRGVV